MSSVGDDATLEVVAYDNTGYPAAPKRVPVGAFPRGMAANDVLAAVCQAVGLEISSVEATITLPSGVVAMASDAVSTLADMTASATATRVMVQVGRAEGADPSLFASRSTTKTASAAGGKKTESCAICMESADDLERFDSNALGCGHGFCAGCLGKLLATDFLEKGKSHLDVGCPYPRCDGRFSDAAFRQYGSTEVLEEYDAVLETIPADPTAPTLSLPRDFSYDFNDAGQLRHVKTGRKFHWVNQAHYDLLGDQVVPHLQQELMVKARQMTEMQLPSDSWLDANPQFEGIPAHVRSNIFLTPDALTNENKLMLLIQGSGAVRAGQWARALCINDSLETGAILGYLDKAEKAGYGVIVFNPNLNSVDADPLADRPSAEVLRTPGRPPRRNHNLIKIPGNSDPLAHTIHVWDHVAKQAKARDIVIVAHSAGGWCTLGLLRERPEVMTRLRAIGFTDAVHSVLPSDPPVVRKAITELAQNWVQSDDPLDTPARGYKAPSGSGCPCVSAGHPKHENTSASAIESVFKFLHDKVDGPDATMTDEDARPDDS